jgi:hypothetical protein
MDSRESIKNIIGFFAFYFILAVDGFGSGFEFFAVNNLPGSFSPGGCCTSLVVPLESRWNVLGGTGVVATGFEASQNVCVIAHNTKSPL